MSVNCTYTKRSYGNAGGIYTSWACCAGNEPIGKVVFVASGIVFICPNCAKRSLSSDRHSGFKREAKGCDNCGFGMLFELLDDYYPSPDAAFFVVDQRGLIIACGSGSFELTGLRDVDVIGRSAEDVLAISYEDQGDHLQTVLESGGCVFKAKKREEIHAEDDLPAQVTVDLFPAYDDDGGALLVLTPTK